VLDWPLVVPLSISFMGGAALYLHYHSDPAETQWLLLAAAALVVGAAAAGRRERVALVCLVGSAAVAGYLYAGCRVVSATSSLRAFEERTVTVEGIVLREPEPGSVPCPLPIRVTGVAQDGTLRAASGVVRITAAEVAGAMPGDRVVARGTLRRPPPAGNPGEIDLRMHQAARGVYWFLYPVRGVPVELDRRPAPTPARALAHLRRTLGEGLDAFFPERVAALYRALILGESASDRLCREAFRRTGVAHLLAVSGLHVGLVAAGSRLLAARLPGGPAMAAGAASVVTLGYVGLVGAPASAVRAGLMSLAAMWAIPLRRRYEPLAAVALAAWAIVLAAPAAVSDAGFQLSFAATAGVVVLSGPIARRLAGWPLGRTVAFTLSAQLGVLPLQAYYLNELAPIALLANLVLVPLLGVALPLGLVGAALGALPTCAAGALGPVAGSPAGLLLAVVDGLAAAPVPVWHLPSPPIAVMAAWYLMLVSAWRGRPSLTAVALAAVLVLGAALAVPRAELEVIFVDVGQGDAVVVRSPCGAVAVIDGGGVSREALRSGLRDPGQRVVGVLRRLGVRRVDILVLTHPHTDHAAGLVAVVDGFPVAAFLDGGPAPDACGEYADLLGELAARRVPCRQVEAGTEVILGRGKASAVVLQVLSPDPTNVGPAANDRSLVILLRYGETGFLLMGDAGADTERRLLAGGHRIGADVLKVGHHGSADATTREFLEAVRPLHVVISCGARNPFGHPAPAVLERLVQTGGHVWRTDLHGGIRMTSNGRRVRVFPTRKFQGSAHALRQDLRPGQALWASHP